MEIMRIQQLLMEGYYNSKSNIFFSFNKIFKNKVIKTIIKLIKKQASLIGALSSERED